jgi:hypothetical protein
MNCYSISFQYKREKPTQYTDSAQMHVHVGADSVEQAMAKIRKDHEVLRFYNISDRGILILAE